MRGKIIPKPRTGSTTPPPRDVDLLESDQFLSQEELDELWEWFYIAQVESMDPELVFVKLINFARNPYRHQIPLGYKPPSSSDAQDLISLDHEDEVDQLKHLVTSLKAEITVKDQRITSLEAKDERSRESEKQFVRQLAEKEREVEKRDERLSVLEESESKFNGRLVELQQESVLQKESLERQKKETEALQQKQDELVELLENLTREQLNNGELYREVLRTKEQEIERWKQQSTQDERKLKQLEEDLAGREKELQEIGNDYGKKLSEKEKELESKQATINELHVLVDSHEEDMKHRLGECETKHMESRRELISTVRTALSKKSLSPGFLGLQGEEWTNQQPTPIAQVQRVWSWRG